MQETFGLLIFFWYTLEFFVHVGCKCNILPYQHELSRICCSSIRQRSSWNFADRTQSLSDIVIVKFECPIGCRSFVSTQRIYVCLCCINMNLDSEVKLFSNHPPTYYVGTGKWFIAVISSEAGPTTFTVDFMHALDML